MGWNHQPDTNQIMIFMMLKWSKKYFSYRFIPPNLYTHCFSKFMQHSCSFGNQRSHGSLKNNWYAKLFTLGTGIIPRLVISDFQLLCFSWMIWLQVCLCPIFDACFLPPKSNSSQTKKWMVGVGILVSSFLLGRFWPIFRGDFKLVLGSLTPPGAWVIPGPGLPIQWTSGQIEKREQKHVFWGP